MKILNDLIVGKKVGLLVMLSAFFLCVVGYAGYYYLLKSNSDMTAMYQDRLLPVKQLNENRAHARAIEADMYQMMLSTDRNQTQNLKQDIDKRTALFNKNLEEYEQTTLDAKEMELLQKLKTSLQAYRSSRTEVLALAMDNKNSQAYQLFTEHTQKDAEDFLKYMGDLAKYNADAAENIANENTQNFDRAKMVFLFILLTAFAILLAGSFLVVKAVTAPLQAVVKRLDVIAANDYSTDIDKEFLDRKDEFGRLGAGFNKVNKSMRALIAQMAESSEQVSAASEELTASAQESAQATTQVASAITEVASGSEQQVVSADKAALIVERMSDGIQKIAANTNNVAGTSDKTAAAAKEGNQAIETAIEQMQTIEETVNKSAGVVERLGNRSKEIGQIVDTIAGIAGQTNLLALNAAIEAARAGEQGRGFAVVAEEVRKLAEQSQSAAKQIEELINEIQNETDRAVTAMQLGSKEVRTGSQVVNSAGKDFVAITALVQSLSTEVLDISGAIQQMADGSQEIVHAVKEIDDISKNTSGHTQTVSAAAEEQAASMEQIAASSEGLAKMAETLQTVIQRFKV